MGPSIYDVHAEGGSGSGVRLRTGNGDVSSTRTYIRKIRAHPIFFSCKEVVVFWISSIDGIKGGNFSSI